MTKKYDIIKGMENDYLIKVFENGVLKQEVTNPDILESFREIKLNPKELKGAIRIEASKNNRKYFKVFPIHRARIFLINDVNRQIIAKNFRMALP